MIYLRTCVCLSSDEDSISDYFSFLSFFPIFLSRSFNYLFKEYLNEDRVNECGEKTYDSMHVRVCVWYLRTSRVKNNEFCNKQLKKHEKTHETTKKTRKNAKNISML